MERTDKIYGLTNIDLLLLERKKLKKKNPNKKSSIAPPPWVFTLHCLDPLPPQITISPPQLNG